MEKWHMAHRYSMIHGLLVACEGASNSKSYMWRIWFTLFKPKYEFDVITTIYYFLSMIIFWFQGEELKRN